MDVATIGGATIARVLIVDDDPNAREGFGYSIEDLGLEPVFEGGPIEDVASFLGSLPERADAILCDFNLRLHAYAKMDGDTLTAECYKAGIPGLLCTGFTDVDTMLNKRHLRYIPSLLRKSDPSPDEIAISYENCIRELRGEFHQTRKPYRTLVRVVDIDDEGRYFHVVLPGWDPKKKIRLYKKDLPLGVQQLAAPGARLHAQVNIGAQSFEMLYFDDWETS